ncbi:MAG: LysR family transcriptional regulator [Rhodobacteraceae bacterium]|nr:LysR family transcriptional regulator [Paracoccaceae bacterium]
MSYLDNLRLFVRIYELKNLSTAGHDLRLTPAVASSRLKALETHLGVRLFNRTTRKLTPTEQGAALYDGALKVFEALTEAESAVASISRAPRGAIRITAPLGVGRRIVAPAIPGFHAEYPEITVRLRLSDHVVDLMTEGIDAAVVLGVLKDSNLRVLRILECPRVLAASPAYLARAGVPRTPRDLAAGHQCLLLRYTGSPEYVWTLATPGGPLRLELAGPFDTDDGEVLADWALAGHGVVNLARFLVAGHLASGALVEVLPETPPAPAELAIVYPHKRLMDPKLRVFIDYMAEQCRARVLALQRVAPSPAKGARSA